MQRAKDHVTRQAPLVICALLVAAFLCKPAQASSQTDRDKVLALRAEAKAYEYGSGQARNPDKAVEFYCEAAHLGDAEAQYSLGWMYAMGRGIDRNDSAAAYFFTLAAQQGDSLAVRMLKQVGPPPNKPPDCIANILARFDAQGHDIIAKAVPEHRKVMNLVQRLAPEYGVYPRLAMAIIRAESNFNPAAVSPKNAQGLMQLIPETAERFNVKKPFDPEQNIRGGLAYLRWLLAYYEGNIALVAAAYNAGEGTVNRYAGIPPYAETQGYVKRIREIFKKEEHPFDAQITPPSPDLPRILNAKRLM
ncbi:lytic transglycosylase domain-containing protein [Dechloromonas sp. ARDL1]|uniref:lytic transglycosylase domain-containing protein n=1 Tax=Dechloromonas sp. ARDL1 TaxID=3322121 RepID=UPI003DA769F9